MRKGGFAVVLLTYLFAGCTHNEPLFTLLSSSHTGIDFNNTIIENDSINVLNFEYIYNGAGVGVGDFNHDGLQDLFFSGNQVSSKLYLNQGDLHFKDVTALSGIVSPYWSSGVSIADVNADGLEDIYLCTVNPDRDGHSPNLLFLNKGIDKHGIPHFEEVGKLAGLDDESYSTQAAFFDYDRDGDLDVYLLNNALEYYDRNLPRKQLTNGKGKSTDRLYRNEGLSVQGIPTFTNVSKEAGITTEGWGLGVVVSDINEDGWPDVYCANDFMSNDLLWVNNQNGTFTNRISEMIQHQSLNSMGTDVADINNDTHVDIITLDMMPEDNLRQKTMFSKPLYERYELNLSRGYQPQYVRNMLQLNNGADSKGRFNFREIGQLAGIYATDWSWSALWADFDNDGFRDLFISNGYKKDVTSLDFIQYNEQSSFPFSPEDEKSKRERLKKMEKLLGVKKSNFIFKNRGDLTFQDQTSNWGLDKSSYSNGAIYADLDNDGDLDIVTNNIDDKPFVYRNNIIHQEKNDSAHYIRINLSGGDMNLRGFGAKAFIFLNGEQRLAECNPVRGYQSSVESTLHVGLGKSNKIDSIRIVWPDQKIANYYNLAADTSYLFSCNDTLAIKRTQKRIETLPTFNEVSVGIQFVHRENYFVDFKNQILIPHMYSRLGPGIAVADINNDGLEDVFVGAATEGRNQIFTQRVDHTFESNNTSFNFGINTVDNTSSLLIDVDGDSDVDLLSLSGGNEKNLGSDAYQPKLYRNDGKGNFALDNKALPSVRISATAAVAADFDKDGDLDIFVASRNTPQKYPVPGNHYLFINNKGAFEDRTPASIQKLGMISSALWTDFDNDTWIDLIVVGEFMPITFLKNVKGSLVNVTDNNMSNRTLGWWNSITGSDFDNDGDTDYVMGNFGINNRFSASVDEPVCLYAKDFDKNGSIDPILCQYIQGKNYPVHPRDQLAEQIPIFKKRFTSFASYGAQTFEQMIRSDELHDAYTLKCTMMQSVYVENLGDGKFTERPLPMLAQTAPVFGIIADDVDHDGRTDLMIGGNLYSTDVQIGRYDALPLQVLKGNGRGYFTCMSQEQSGISLNKDVKGLAEVFAPGIRLLIAAANNDSLTVFQMKENSSFITPLQDEVYAIVEFAGDQKRKVEFYYGSGYMSQSSRSFTPPPQTKAIRFYNSRGLSRTLQVKN
jgi:hypothetical protein